MRKAETLFGRMAVVLAGGMLLAAAGCAAEATRPEAQTPAAKAEYASHTVDFGIVVSDIERATSFYKNALGLTELPGFDVPGGMAGDSGLSAYKSFHVRVFVTDKKPGATKVKLMQFADTTPKSADNAFIHTQLGIRYLTFAVKDITAAVEQAAKWGATPIAKGPVALPAGFPKGIYLAVVRDPDGNMIELVGPKAEETAKPAAKPAPAEKPKAGEKPAATTIKPLASPKKTMEGK